MSAGHALLAGSAASGIESAVLRGRQDEALSAAVAAASIVTARRGTTCQIVTAAVDAYLHRMAAGDPTPAAATNVAHVGGLTIHEWVQIANDRKAETIQLQDTISRLRALIGTKALPTARDILDGAQPVRCECGSPVVGWGPDCRLCEACGQKAAGSELEDAALAAAGIDPERTAA